MVARFIARERCAWVLATLLSSGCGLRADTGMGSGSDDPMDPSSAMAGTAGATSEGEDQDDVAATPEPGGATWQRGLALRGAYAYALEGSAFLPCGGSDYWWADFEGLALERFQEVAFDVGCEERGCLFAAAGEGDVSPPGRYGRDSAYARSVTFTRLTSFSLTRVASSPVALNSVNCELR
jgi:hypothetical protein